MNNKKHPPPKWCHMRRALVGVSPSALLGSCRLGVRPRRTQKCEGCTHNIEEALWEGFQEGLRRGMETPSIYEQLRDMALQKLEEMPRPELTYEIKAADLLALDTLDYKDGMESRRVHIDENNNIILLPKE